MIGLLAQESSSLLELATDFSEGKTYNYWGEFVNMMITLLLIVGLIFVSIIVLKKIMRSRMHYINRGARIKVVERRPLSQKSSLYLVDISGKRLVISESQAGIHFIADAPEEEEESSEEGEPAPFSLSQKLHKLVRKNA